MPSVKHLAWVNPFLAAVFPVIFLLALNTHEVRSSEAASAMLYVLGGTALFVLFLWFVLRDPIKVGFLTCVWLLLFFAYGHVLELSQGAKFVGFEIGRNRHLLPMTLILVGLSLWVAFRAPKFSYSLTPYITIALVILLVVNLATVVAYEFGRTSTDLSALDGANEMVLPNIQPERLPNIYYIILDSYASNDVLRDYYDFDNVEFIDYLKQHDFYVVEEARSNYVTTWLSLTSSLNMEYLNHFAETIGVDSRDRTIPYEMMRDNAVTRLAKEVGYQIVYFSSPFDRSLKRSPNVDVWITSSRYPFPKAGRLFFEPILNNEFASTLLGTTLASPFLRNLVSVNRGARFTGKIEELQKIPRIEAPTFTFVHFVPPHPPFVFDREGNVRNVTTDEQWDNRPNLYTDQLIWVNKSMETALDSILNDAGDRSVIIIQGDHGPRSQPYFEGREIRGDFIRERSSILNAYHLAEECKPANLHQSITPVNTFRVIFDACLGTDFGLLPDETYWSSEQRPYDFTPVGANP